MDDNLKGGLRNNTFLLHYIYIYIYYYDNNHIKYCQSIGTHQSFLYPGHRLN